MKIKSLRKTYPQFFYRGYSYKVEGKNLKISFDFAVPPDIVFRPRIIIKDIPLPKPGLGHRPKPGLGNLGNLDNLVFHLGLMEIPSYWKATCSPEIVVEAGYLNKDQILWWKDLIFNGMGEYFYKNKINFTKPNFLKISSTQSLPKPLPKPGLGRRPKPGLGNKTLVPVGGGKDAVVTLELLKKAGMPLRPFLLNPKPEQEKILSLAKVQKPIVVERTIDPELLELNRKGYLNGHTPFSAYLAFLSVFAAILFDYKYIALSNERSSNEGNVKYLGKTINHQYSKTYEFEKKFREYSKKYLTKDAEYFSFLRPLYELQIAKTFVRYPKYFEAFLSCNESHKTYSGRKPTGLPAEALAKAGKWCGKCAKCLFIWLALYPFVQKRQLINIFKKDLSRDKSLTPLVEQLTGKRKFKPFECVGTIKETRAALSLRLGKILSSWNKNHFLPPRFSRLLSRAKIGGK